MFMFFVITIYRPLYIIYFVLSIYYLLFTTHYLLWFLYHLPLTICYCSAFMVDDVMSLFYPSS